MASTAADSISIWLESPLVDESVALDEPLTNQGRVGSKEPR